MNDTGLSVSSSPPLAPSSSGMTEEELVYWDSVLSDSRYTVQSILVPIVLIIGAFGNSITIAVMTRRHMQTSTNLYLTALAISDLMYLVFMFSLSLKHTPGMTHQDHLLYWHYYRYALWLTDASSSTSIWLTVTFTVERYIAVCHPMKGKVLCTQSRAKRLIVSVYFLCFLLTSTTPHEWMVVPNPSMNNTHVMLDYSDLGKDETYKKAFYWFSAVIFILLPLLLLATFNTFLVLAVKRSRKQRRVMTNVRREGQSMQENKITVMLIAVVLLALICQMPTAVMLMYTSFHQLEPETVEFYICIIMNNFFNLLTGVNAAVNFVFYCALSNRYRMTFLQTFCNRWYTKHHPANSWIATTGYTNVDMSPRTSFRSSYRGSSVRTSQRSSYRSSLSSTPRASPSHSSYKGMERRNIAGSFLRVPSPSHGSRPLQDETITDIPFCESPESLEMPLQNGRLWQSSKLRLEEHEMENLCAAQEISNIAISVNSDDESISDNPPKPSPRMKRKFQFRRMLRIFHGQSLFNRGPPLTNASQNILIKCQQPSSDDQVQTNV